MTGAARRRTQWLPTAGQPIFVTDVGNGKLVLRIFGDRLIPRRPDIQTVELVGYTAA